MDPKILLIPILLITILTVSGCTDMIMREAGTFVRLPSCNWVFKTRADYSGLISVSLSQDKSRVTTVPFFSEIEALDQGYHTGVSGCEYTEKWVIAFINITTEEWNQAQEECWQKIRQPADNNDTSATKKRRTEHDTGPVPVQIESEYQICDSDLLLEILVNFTRYIHDDAPFTELYICDFPKEDLNPVINSGDLESRCERII